ncbi:hypothetical protein Tco_0074541, partial [Tanacetum coccineum]
MQPNLILKRVQKKWEMLKSLSVSSGYGTQFLNSSSDISLTDVFKDTTETDVIIPETTNLPPILETPVTTAVSSSQVTPIISPMQQSSTPIPTPPITIDAPIVTTAVPESDALNAIQIRTHVPTVVDNYLDSKVGDVFQKELQKHTADFIQKYSLQRLLEITKKPTPAIDMEQETEKSHLEILKLKKEYVEKQQTTQFTIKSTDKATLKEFDLKSALYLHMHENKSFYINPANHKLYHALMEALIEDKNAMDKGVADT